MRKSKVLNKFRSGKFARMCGMGHFLPFFIRHAAHSRYDGIWFDLEHRTMDDREVQSILALCHLHDIDCMIRPSTREPARLYRYLEEGAAGFMFPFVNNAEVARQLVRAVKFPPLGDRGVDGAGMDADYTLAAWTPGADYCGEANRETFILAQIEAPEALDNVDEIAAVEGIDCLFVGPADLTRRMSSLPGAKPFVLDDAVRRVADAASRAGKAWGVTVPSLEALAKYRKMGGQVMPWGGDYFLVGVLDQCRRDLDGVLEPE